MDVILNNYSEIAVGLYHENRSGSATYLFTFLSLNIDFLFTNSS